MKKFFILAAIAIAAVFTSCAKVNTTPDTIPVPEEWNEPVTISEIEVAFDAPDLDVVDIEFYDENGQGIALVSVPVQEGKIVVSAATKPVALYTDGLEGLNEDGVKPIPQTSIVTKADAPEAMLLVIRR